jgi:hypothetical protein
VSGSCSNVRLDNGCSIARHRICHAAQPGPVQVEWSVNSHRLHPYPCDHINTVWRHYPAGRLADTYGPSHSNASAWSTYVPLSTQGSVDSSLGLLHGHVRSESPWSCEFGVSYNG